MRKLLALFVLVPFAAVFVLSCDDPPTAPEQAEAATTVQESPTPQASRQPPALPMPVRLSGWVRSYDDVNEIAPGMPGFSLALCPSGTVAITGGFDTAGTTDFVLKRSNPDTSIDGQPGWMVAVINESSTETLYMRAVAACVAGTVGE